jgi:hypothetical protein
MRRQSAKAGAIFGISISILLVAGTLGRSDTAVENIVFIRHGEKPEKGLGQLNCQGLNRALALPSVIDQSFGRPDAIFAPNPLDRKTDDGELFDYVRPLATIEPTAIFFGLPVDVSIGFSEVKRLLFTLDQLKYRNALILIAWEHKLIEETARAVLEAHGGDAGVVPKWHDNDFDSIYVITITRTEDATNAIFTLKQEGLDGQKDTCPR